MMAARDRATGAARDVGQAQHLGRRRRAVGVHEAEHVGIRAAEGLGDHAALAELRIFVQAHAPVFVGVLTNDLGGAVRAAIEGNLKAHVAPATNGPVGTEGATNPVLLVVRGDHDVKTQENLPDGAGVQRTGIRERRRRPRRRNPTTRLGVPMHARPKRGRRHTGPQNVRSYEWTRRMSDSYPIIQDALSDMQKEFMGCVETHLDPPEGNEPSYRVEALYRVDDAPGDGVRFAFMVD